MPIIDLYETVEGVRRDVVVILARLRELEEKEKTPAIPTHTPVDLGQPFIKTEDNSLVYNLKQERAYNGKPVMVNDIAVSLSLIRDPDIREKVAGIILSALTAKQEVPAPPAATEPHHCYIDFKDTSLKGMNGHAITYCLEDATGLWCDNDEYATRVNFCPFCGYKAKPVTPA
jgi:hypothetical protein